ncbi:MAG: YihY family inner membrane protein [Xanthomonadales bacterium]
MKQSLDVPEQWRRGRRLARHVWTHFQEDRCLAEAASLSYTSLLSLVPLLAVAFGIVAAFPVFEEWAERLQAVILENVMPTVGEQIVPYLNSFLNSVSKLTLVGIVGLIATAILLLNRIESAFNRIWRVDQGRTLVNRLTMYWAVLTLAPIMLAAAVAIGAQGVFGFLSTTGETPPLVYRSGVFLMTLMTFATVFLLVPNRSVKMKHAFAGAFLSAVLFEIAKVGFVAYAANTNYTVIYGAIALVPIFLFWLYLVWTVILFGASLAASLTTFTEYSRYETRWPERFEFQLAYRLLGHFWEAQKRGESLSRDRLFELESHASEHQLMKLIAGLRDCRVLSASGEDAWVLARGLEDFTLGDLYRCGDYYLPLGATDELPRQTARDEALVRALEDLAERSEDIWQRPLRHFFMEPETREDAE